MGNLTLIDDIACPDTDDFGRSHIWKGPGQIGLYELPTTIP